MYFPRLLNTRKLLLCSPFASAGPSPVTQFSSFLSATAATPKPHQDKLGSLDSKMEQ